MSHTYIQPAYRDAIDVMIRDAHKGNVTTHLMTYEYLRDTVIELDAHLRKVPKKFWHGLEITITTATKKPSAYGYGFGADVATICWTRRGWAVKAVWRKTYFANMRIAENFSYDTSSETGQERANELKDFLLNDFFRFS